ncbi:MAG: DedA family protein [Hyphomicrobiaceae bacterium]|nr:DedA family protein [Hyphomicrobiaceae bacterium]
MSELVAQYGYLAVLIGTIFEGETILVLGAVAAKLGYLKIGLVVLVAWIGSFVGDQAYFWIGRLYGIRLLARWPSWRMRVHRVTHLLEKYDTWFILGFRFVYGIRSISPFVIGMSRIAAWRFMLLNLIAAFLWATALGGVSFLLGAVMKTVLARFEVVEHYAIVIVAAAGILLWIAHLVRTRQRTEQYLETEESAKKVGKSPDSGV